MPSDANVTTTAPAAAGADTSSSATTTTTTTTAAMNEKASAVPAAAGTTDSSSSVTTTTNEKEAAAAATAPAPAFSKEEFLSPDFKPKHLNKIVQEGIILGAGAAAILLQVAEAGVGQGVNQHSNFAYRVQDRLRTTMTFVYCMSFGTPAEKLAIADMITRVHSTVSGTLDDGRDAGRPYSALDPRLQMWVAATLYATGIGIYERVWGPDAIASEEEHEQIYREYSILACSLQVPPEMWPASRAAFWRYWDAQVASIEVTDHARAVAADLLYLRKAPAHLRVFMPSVRLCTAEWLPERIREAYAVRRHPRWYKVHEFMVRAIYRPLPLRLRSYPSRMYMKDMRKRLAKNQKVFEKA
ncbi:hypothetical protein GGR56DRAFT_679267 [Xylariaceae sp. FL0804]|nr:hypothetical protein GGR56DRAFT_679267 [Xylariaceae sp. FL0804]